LNGDVHEQVSGAIGSEACGLALKLEDLAIFDGEVYLDVLREAEQGVGLCGFGGDAEPQVEIVALSLGRCELYGRRPGHAANAVGQALPAQMHGDHVAVGHFYQFMAGFAAA